MSEVRLVQLAVYKNEGLHREQAMLLLCARMVNDSLTSMQMVRCDLFKFH